MSQAHCDQASALRARSACERPADGPSATLTGLEACLDVLASSVNAPESRALTRHLRRTMHKLGVIVAEHIVDPAAWTPAVQERLVRSCAQVLVLHPDPRGCAWLGSTLRDLARLHPEPGAVAPMVVVHGSHADATLATGVCHAAGAWLHTRPVLVGVVPRRCADAPLRHAAARVARVLTTAQERQPAARHQPISPPIHVRTGPRVQLPPVGTAFANRISRIAGAQPAAEARR